MEKEKKIVLAEDNSVLSLLLKLSLQKAGYKLFIALDGKQAIDLIEEHNPDVILTDIMMDYFSGLEIVSHVRNELKKNTPILVFSSSGQEEMVLNAFNLGANDFMSKPLSTSELVFRVKKMLLTSNG
ncbi:response regulator [Polaribacter sp. SA4-12]|uniref:response regulator n=1 Tax=Polaribacter sp. SA4-12 TaxID=1312072 RepID=UPI000B3CC7AE|nr:response regulator [Polaribacter sp. SA4-12]ARV16752.1 response regulator [Polaribacter sp. SA4-12]